MHRKFRESCERQLLAVVPRDHKVAIGYRLKRALSTIDPLIAQMTSFVKPSGRALDIGANDGTFAYALSRLSPCVDAFEPQPELAARIAGLRKHRKNITIHACGLSNTSGTLQLHVPLVTRTFRRPYVNTALGTFRSEAASGSTTMTLDVPVKTLDDFAFDDVTFMKIDVEGHEAEVIEGAGATILKCKPVILVEIEQRHVGRERLFETVARIERLGYVGSFFEHGRRRNMSDFSPDVHQTSSANYVNNFFFTPHPS